MTDCFHNKHQLANTINQLQPQQLSKNVWIGPLNSIVQRNVLNQNNIKYIIGVLPSQKCCYYLRDHLTGEFICAAIDPSFNIHKMTEDEGELLMKFNSFFSPKISQLTEKKITNSVITNTNFGKLIDDYLLLINSIILHDPNAGILLFSINGNDNLLISLAMSYIIDSHNCDVQTSFNYIRSIRPSIQDFQADSLYSNELINFQTTNKARKLFGNGGSNANSNINSSNKSKRSVEEAEHSSPRNLKRSL